MVTPRLESEMKEGKKMLSGANREEERNATTQNFLNFQYISSKDFYLR